MGVREIDLFLEQWQMGIRDLRRRTILAYTSRERGRHPEPKQLPELAAPAGICPQSAKEAFGQGG